ncbi:MAG: phosphoglycerate dehydrogenase [Oscillospiraceae bacterium]|nr:phosphoglycerate dehydrogenase [Oscillospiraceae bacterium]
MFKVRTFNKISDVIRGYLPNDDFALSDSAEDYEAILVRSASLHEESFPESLLAIARAGAGVNNIPLERCSEKGVVVFNAPGANANAVKELVLCGLLLSGRQVVQGIDWVASEGAKIEDVAAHVEKIKSRFAGPELLGKSLGVIGLGAIGVMVANSARHGLGMDVVGFDPYLSIESAWHLDRKIGKAADIDELLAKSDFVSLHLPLNEETKNMFDARRISKMRQGAVLLNFARGGLVDNAAVLEALSSGRLSRYICDFPEPELIGKEGVICTPHLGASTPESEENCAVMAARELAAYLRDGNIRNSVNFPDCELPRDGGCRLCMFNENIKNMLGQISAVIAEYSHNIDHMINKSRGQMAYTLIDLPERPTGECLDKIKDIEGVVRVRVIE